MNSAGGSFGLAFAGAMLATLSARIAAAGRPPVREGLRSMLI